MKLIALIILLASSTAFGQSAQYVDQIDKPTPISNAKHDASLKRVKAADQKQQADRAAREWVIARDDRYLPPVVRSTNYGAIAAHDRKQRSRPSPR
jgi:hypothetical protein